MNYDAELIKTQCFFGKHFQNQIRVHIFHSFKSFSFVSELLLCFRAAVRTLISLAFLFGTISCVAPGIYCYGTHTARLASDIYWYSAKLLLNVANCITMVIVYIKVLLQFREKQRKLEQRRAAVLGPAPGCPAPQMPMGDTHEAMRLTNDQCNIQNGVITHTLVGHGIFYVNFFRSKQ